MLCLYVVHKQFTYWHFTVLLSSMLTQNYERKTKMSSNSLLPISRLFSKWLIKIISFSLLDFPSLDPIQKQTKKIVHPNINCRPWLCTKEINCKNKTNKLQIYHFKPNSNHKKKQNAHLAHLYF